MLTLRLSLALAAALPVPPAQQSDSQRILRIGRDAQADFEWIRRRHLPPRPSYAAGTCDEHIGRFCFWHDDDGEDLPPEEAGRIREARVRLVQQLDSVAALLPGDEWIAGQRVRYLVEAGRFADAARAARGCQAVAWWCEALLGLALHAAGDFAGADTAYRSAVRDMPQEARCRWTDVSLLLEGELARRYDRLPCGDRAIFEERLWWLAQPFYARPGNDRRTEHFARATLSRLAEKARNAYGVSWGDDLREITLRYGWPAYWTQGSAGPSAASDIVVTGHEPSPAFHFLPDARAFDVPGRGAPDDWALGAARPREKYQPAYAKSIMPLEHQVALFRRGDSCLVVAAYDVNRDSLFAAESLDAALVLARDERSAPVLERRPAAASSDVIVAKAACGPLLLSLEVLAPARRHGARARYGVVPPAAPDGGIAVSDIVLFDPPPPAPPSPAPPDSLPSDLAAVLSLIRGTATAPRGSRLGIFWEVYGLDSTGEVVTASVSLAPARSGWLRRATESLGLARRRAPVRLEWTELPRLHRLVAGRALAVDLSGISPGRYRIEVRVATARGAGVATRQLEVVEQLSPRLPPAASGAPPLRPTR